MFIMDVLMEIKFLETREIYVSKTRSHHEIMKFIVRGDEK